MRTLVRPTSSLSSNKRVLNESNEEAPFSRDFPNPHYESESLVKGITSGSMQS